MTSAQNISGPQRTHNAHSGEPRDRVRMAATEAAARESLPIGARRRDERFANAGYRIVAFHPDLTARIGREAGLLMDQLMYLSNLPAAVKRGRWVFKTARDLACETGLSPTEQRSARRKLVNAGWVREQRARWRVWFQIVFDPFGNCAIPDHLVGSPAPPAPGIQKSPWRTSQKSAGLTSQAIQKSGGRTSQPIQKSAGRTPVGGQTTEKNQITETPKREQRGSHSLGEASPDFARRPNDAEPCGASRARRAESGGAEPGQQGVEAERALILRALDSLGLSRPGSAPMMARYRAMLHRARELHGDEATPDNLLAAIEEAKRRNERRAWDGHQDLRVIWGVKFPEYLVETGESWQVHRSGADLKAWRQGIADQLARHREKAGQDAEGADMFRADVSS